MPREDTIREVLDAINRHDVEAFSALYADDAVVHDPQYPEPLRGRSAIRRDMEDFLRTFPDLHGDLRSTIEAEGIASFEAHMSGTHQGPLPGPSGEIPPTGKRVEMDAGIFCKFDEKGQIVEERRYYDVAGLMGQLGLGGPADVEPTGSAPTA
jgi:steroid delta-isomerase-like uncharacterized protein